MSITKKIAFLFLAGTMLAKNTQAQCSTPTSASVGITNITCLNSGTVTVNSVNSGGTALNLGDCRYTLYNAANTAIVKPEQANPVIAGVDSGTYILHIHQVCPSAGISNDYTQTVHLSGYYELLALNTPTIVSAGCNNGSISISATGGYGTYSYCLVHSQNDPSSPASYVRAPQASGEFDNLPSGNYFVRVYDNCGFVTMPVTIQSVPATSPFGYATITLDGCNGYSLNVETGWDIPIDANNRWWIAYPDGTADTIPDRVANQGFNLPVSYAKLAAYYPSAIIKIGYKDPCGNIFYKSYGPFNAPKYWVSDQRAYNYSCTQGVYYINQPYLRDSANEFVNTPYNEWDAYSLDGGANWIPYSYPNSDTLLVDVNGGTRQIMYRRCGQQYPITINGPVSVALSMDAFQRGVVSCNGNASISIYGDSYNGDPNKLLVETIMVPAGQASIPPFYYSYDGSTYVYDAPELTNLIPGHYEFRYTDECGNTDTSQLDLLPFHDTLTARPVFTCGRNTIDMVLHYTHDPVGGSFFIYYEVRNHNNVLVYSSNSYGDDDILLNGYTPDIYYIKAWKVDFTGTVSTENLCPWNFTVDARLPGALNINKSIFALCTNDLSTGSIITLPTGGIPPYTYALYKGSISAANQVGTAQSSNIFSNLDANVIYWVSVTDNCGSGNSLPNQFGNVQPVPSSSLPTVPCMGEAITLSISGNQGLSYQWTRNGVAIPNATDTLYKIQSMTMADSGAYGVTISANSCLLLSQIMQLDPKNCGVPIPLSIDLLSFSGNVNNDANAVLNWKTAQPEAGATFLVLYSTDGAQFATAGTVLQDGKNTQFAFTHRDYKITGKTYYKLLMVGKDGKTKYSNVIVLQAGKITDNKVAVSPLPFTTELNLVYTATKNTSITMQITDVNGRLIKTTEAAINTGINNLRINGLDVLPNGIYMLRIINSEGEQQILKLQK